LAIVLAVGCGGTDGGRGFGGPIDTDAGSDDDENDDDDPLDSISASASATQGGTSTGPTTAPPTTDPTESDSASDPSSSSDPSSAGPASDTTTGPMSSSSEAEGTTSCDQLVATWGDCLNYGVGACENEDATCVVDNPAASTLGTCSLLDCVHDCDCPDPPGTGTAASRCDAILVGGQTACYLNCSGGATCPDGMQCWQNQICMFSDLVCEDPPAPGTFGDCADSGNGVCGDAGALCLVDDPDDTTMGVCAFPGCVTDCDCPAAPATGDAPVACAPIVADSDENACFLDCSSGQTCPDGMTCVSDFICMW
jgi:hypothetical protein